MRQDRRPVGLERVLQESEKLECIHQLGLPADLFSYISAKTLDSYRQRIAVEELQEVRRHPDPIRFTLLAAYCGSSILLGTGSIIFCDILVLATHL